MGIDKSWMYVYPSDDADDGVIDFQISYTDIAGNPGVPLTKATDGKTIIRDAIEPELDEVVLFTSNPYDSSLAIEGDTVFLTFNSSEQIRDIKILLNSSEAILKNKRNFFGFEGGRRKAFFCRGCTVHFVPQFIRVYGGVCDTSLAPFIEGCDKNLIAAPPRKSNYALVSGLIQA